MLNSKSRGRPFGAIDFESRWTQCAWFLAFALLTRFSVFGDPHYTNDEAFYFLVGQRAHEGFLPYVDIWDRKGPGLFLVYYLIAGVSGSLLAYQIAALLAAAATAQVVNLLSERISDRKGAMFAGTFYLALLPLYGGGGGQSPVFYNIFMALSALLVVQARARLREGRVGAPVYLAMASAGLAITFKQTAIAESAFLGCYCLWQMRGIGPVKLLRSALLMMLAGAGPTLLFGAGIAVFGHFGEFWQAMVGSNLQRTYYPAGATLERGIKFALYCSPAALLALTGIVPKHASVLWARPFLTGWLVASIAGVLMVPNFFEHYALPFALPASVAASRFVYCRGLRPLYVYVVLAAVVLIGPAFRFEDRRESRTSIARIVGEIRARDPQPRLLVYEGPIYLYRLVDSYPPSPLLFPFHLFFPYEDNASQYDTAAEMDRILKWKPTVVVTYHDYPLSEENPRTSLKVREYIGHCRLWFTTPGNQAFHTNDLDVYGDCPR